jgi:hypothetical protein
MVQAMAVVEPRWHIAVDFTSCGCMLDHSKLQEYSTWWVPAIFCFLICH